MKDKEKESRLNRKKTEETSRRSSETFEGSTGSISGEIKEDGRYESKVEREGMTGAHSWVEH